MQNLLDCQILKDGLDSIKGQNKVIRDSLRYRFLYENTKNVNNIEVQYNLDYLSNWYKWYNTTYCKTLQPCLTTNTVTCIIYVSELYDATCISDFIVTEIN